MTYNTHPFQPMQDYDLLRKFLRETFILNDYTEKNWSVQRLDYFYWHIWMNCFELPPEEGALIVKDTDGSLIGAIINEVGGAVSLQVHPDHFNRELLTFMVEQSEQSFCGSLPDGRKRLSVACEQQNLMLLDILSERGYRKGTGEDLCGRVNLLEIQHWNTPIFLWNLGSMNIDRCYPQCPSTPLRMTHCG